MARERLGLPVSRLRARRRQRAYRLGLLWFLCALAVLGGIVGLTYLPALQIREVVVAGPTSVAAAMIEERVEQELSGKRLLVFPERNIFLYPHDRILAALAYEFPKLKGIEVNFKTFGSIEVTAFERDPSALWCSQAPEPDTAPESEEGESCYLLDEDGFVFAPAPEFSGVVYVRYYGALPAETPLRSRFLTQDSFRSLSSLVVALAAASGDEPVRVRVEGADIALSFLEGYEVKFAQGGQPQDVVKRFKLALEAEPLRSAARSSISYIDLRFGNKLYYRLQ